MSTITVVGSLNMDLVVRTPRFPEAGETIDGYDFHTIPGGKGANQAVAAARQSDKVSMIGSVGADAFGERILTALRDEGIDTGHIAIAKSAATGVAIVLVEAHGENRIVLAPGANHALAPEDVEALEGVIAASDALVMQLEVPTPVVSRAASIARGHGVPVVLNAAPARPLPPELLARVDYLIVNGTEAALLSGRPPAEPEQAARILMQTGPRSVIVTLGARGAIYVDSSDIVSVPGFKVSAVDTTAAGDAFIGAFTSALTSGSRLDDAVRWANAAGALATTRFGAQPSLPTRDEVAGFLGEQARG